MALIILPNSEEMSRKLTELKAAFQRKRKAWRANKTHAIALLLSEGIIRNCQWKPIDFD